MTVKRRATITVTQVRRFIQAARAEDPFSVIEFITESGTVRITPDRPRIEPAEQGPHDGRKPISWT